MERIEEVLRYWFADADASALSVDAMRGRIGHWFAESREIDEHVRSNFLAELEAAAAGHLDGWAATPRGRLALVVILDQFSRNAYRGTPKAFGLDARALALTEEGIREGVDREFNAAHRVAFYLPIMHAEDRERQQRSLDLYRRVFEESPELSPVLSLVVDAAQRHARIVERFGRYPHRNAVLGRETTPEEAEFMSQPNSSYQPDKK